MDGTIHLHDYRCCMAIEIGDESFDHLLPAKRQTVEAIGAEVVPEAGLLMSWVLTKFAGALHLAFVNPLTDDNVPYPGHLGTSVVDALLGGRTPPPRPLPEAERGRSSTTRRGTL